MIVRSSFVALSLAEHRRLSSRPRTGWMEQSWNKSRGNTLRFPAFTRKHCSIDLRCFLRGPHPPQGRKKNSAHFSVPNLSVSPHSHSRHAATHPLARHIRPSPVTAVPYPLPSTLFAPFCPSTSDKNPLVTNQACVIRSIAGGTPSVRQTTLNTSRKLIGKCDCQNQYSFLFVTSRAPSTLRLFDSDPLALPRQRQNYPILSPFSDFHWRATKFPLRSRSTQPTFVQLNCNERIPPPLLAPHRALLVLRPLPTTEVTKLTSNRHFLPSSFFRPHLSVTK